MEYENLFADLPFIRPGRIDKAANTLEGILEGILIDGKVNQREVRELREWVDDHRQLVGRHPFNELIPAVEAAVEDGYLSSEEHEDLIWLCRNLQGRNGYFDRVTAEIQKLHGIFHGILADGVLSDEEIYRLNDWIQENEHLRGSYPYDEIDAVLVAILKDKVIDENERRFLEVFLSEFVSFSLQRRIEDAREGSDLPLQISGVCAVSPEILIDGKTFSWTGGSQKMPRRKIGELICERGGVFSDNVTQEIDYLVVGNHGNPAWAFACYGRKVEKAVQMRRGGHRLLIVHEIDFWDTLQ